MKSKYSAGSEHNCRCGAAGVSNAKDKAQQLPKQSFGPSKRKRRLLNYAKDSFGVVIGTCGEEELIGVPVIAVASAKIDRPELVDIDGVAGGVADSSNKLTGRRIKGVDRAGKVYVVRYQQGVAQRTEVRRSNRESPRLVQWTARGQMLHEPALFGEDVDDSARATRAVSERNIQQTSDVANAEHGESFRYRSIREEAHRLEMIVKNVNFVICRVGGKQEIWAGRVVGDRQRSV